MPTRTRSLSLLFATTLVGLAALVLAMAIVGSGGAANRAAREVLEERYPDGRIHVRREVARGTDGQPVNDGRLTVWHPNGQVRSVGTWVGGQKHGRFTHWHANGQKARELAYDQGQAHGLVREWDENGRLVRDERWAAGQRVE